MSDVVRGAGKPYKETRVIKKKNRQTGEIAKTTKVLWCIAIELDPLPNADRNRKVIRRSSRNAVIKAKNDFLNDVAAGVPVKRSSMTVEQWLTYWLPQIAKPRMRPGPYGSYRSMVKCNITPHIGTKKLTKLEPKDIRHMLKEIRAAGLSPRTAQVAYNVLHIAMDDARREPGLGVHGNVVELVNKPRVAKANSQDAAAKALPTGRGRKQRSRAALTSEQARKVIRVALDKRDPLAVRWALALLTGARQGECLGITRDHVNLDTGTIDLSWALQRVPLKRKKGEPLPEQDVYAVEDYDIEPGFEIRPVYRGIALVRPKTDTSKRAIPLPAPLLLLLTAHLNALPPTRCGLLFVDEEGRPLSPERDRREWAQALANAGAPDIVLHAARHTTATLLLEANVPEDVRMAIMGHSSAAAQRLYAHADTGVKRAGLAALNDLLPVQEGPSELAA
ncbi:tyrosine-type recombinase/integrase [Nocardia bovistercoris]|uniref:Site-specific integrase n=1 Tax=Nocardia bovistercoris TaxID=2785916 RepID=A0A931IC97_9NOCA|nr:site-specific integrase [Nocardia bovistercoris]MBH0778769.1 site-specific integrase [Nocardia bovistercoris]